jgi:cellulose synthase/poly-beta-1,6-N-acetylglucosamine synthase-like glycosyltransferase
MGIEEAEKQPKASTSPPEGMIDVSVVLPCLNEEKTVATCVLKARQWFESARLRGEVIVVDNGSTDRSRERAREAGARVIDEPRRGFAEARGRIIVMADADDTYDLSDLGPLVERWWRHHNVVRPHSSLGYRPPAPEAVLPWGASTALSHQMVPVRVTWRVGSFSGAGQDP